ncbi:tail fiber assembly protein [Escherichia coli]|uniref:tail fiber assembly protein n=2 Tax=Escherichia coli TaxID=562 RepID=UPI000D019BF4|nr:tail fiber assembly protein [Escherichia coli]HDX5344549.1 tail fiber assembly protein [Citrobacter sedlakii]EGJ7483050.1 tail fiber assembly protein [Escherichia coli]EHD7802482.1 tail fiber assembly protein [Escherichia coli]EHM8556865.1 tail fiber assembly protein [Escherichia coli]EHP7466875.1 tail fiber assembly protein [Escherichia coli]
MKIYCSLAMSGFYIEGASAEIPDDAVELDEQTYNALMEGNHEEGMEIDFSSFPPTLVKAMPTTDQLIEIAEQQKAQKLSDAQNKISLWQTELQLGIISDEDKASLIAWVGYIKELQSVDTSVVPDVDWPIEPD